MVHIGGVYLIYIQKKEIFLQNDKKLLKKILYGIEKFNKKDNKITLITLKFSIREYGKIKNKNTLR